MSTINFDALDPMRGLLGGGIRRPPRPAAPTPPPARRERPVAPPEPVRGAVVASAPPAPPPATPVPRPAAPKPPPAPTIPPLSLTQREAIAVAIAALGPGTHSADAIALSAWRLWPAAFGMRGGAGHPDTNRVLAKLSGVDGLCGMGWLELVSPRAYALTSIGVRHARLRARAAGIALPEVSR